MADASKLRLVRCPKCKNLLPELPEYSVYKCGGCGTILRAKKIDTGSAVFSGKSDEEKGCGSSDKLEGLVEKGSDNINPTAGTEMEDNMSDNNWRKERALAERKSNFGSGCFKKEIKVGEDSNISEEFKDMRLEQSVEDREYRSVDSYSRLPEHQLSKFTDSVRSWPRMDWLGIESGRFEGLHGSNSSINGQVKTPTFSQRDDGPTNYDPYSLHDRVHVSLPVGVEKLEQERAELLQKLDEVKEQLSRSYHLVDKPRERESVRRTLPHPFRNQVPYHVATQPPATEKLIPRPSYLDYSNRPVAYANHHDIDTRNFYSPRNLNEIPEYDDLFQLHRARKPDHRPPHQYQHVSPPEYYSGKYKDIDLDHFAPYLHENIFHTRTCSCLICYNQNQQVPPRVPPTKGIPVNLSANVYHRDGDHVMLPQENYPLPWSQDVQRHARWPSDRDSDIDGYPRRMVATRKIRQHYHPFAGGAPFITCHKCFELLILPRKKVKLTTSHKLRLRCGACSAVILLKLENNKLVTSDITEIANTSAWNEQSSPEVLNVSHVSSGSLNANFTSSCSDDFKKACYNSKSDVTQHKSLVGKNERYESVKMKGYSSSPSMSSKEQERIPHAIAQEDFSEFPSNNAMSPVPPHLPIWPDSPRYSISRYGQPDKGKHGENDDTVVSTDDTAVSRISYQEDPVRNEAEATELDVSFNEYQNNMSQDFVEMSEEDYRLKFSEGSDSFLVGFIKKSFRDFSRSAHSEETERPKVFINGHPLLDRVVKTAEKHAGPIRPGDYWYDFRAGFWGVMGQPCLGIIPPFIEEFNYPMPTNCCGGKTGIYVNGRELNQRDLDLLACRGLPTTRNKFYIIEISGKVLDEDTGKEHDNLGKLAPTVERTRQGFGMKVPKAVLKSSDP